MDSYLLASELNSASISGVTFRPIHFIPTASKYANQPCSGVYLHILDRTQFLPVFTGIKIIKLVRRLWQNEFKFLEPGQDGRYFFDLLTGTDQVRLGLEDELPAEDIQKACDDDSMQFESIRKRYLLY
jgi:uncharacterized protein YbbC (DUF1343 family)